MLRLWKPRDARLIADLIANRSVYYVLPLQLNTDAQIRDHSRFEGWLRLSSSSWRRLCGKLAVESRLVIKNHPLDMGLLGYDRLIKRLARKFDVVGRIDYLESGDLDSLVRHSRGLVTVNNTVGGVSLGAGLPDPGP